MEVENNFQIVIKARYNNITKFIYLKELTLNNFLNECKRKFNIQCAIGLVKMTDQDNAAIPAEFFSTTVNNFKGCSSFCIKLDVETTDEDEPPLMITPDVRNK